MSEESRNINFHNCPKYEKHELTTDQIKAITFEAAKLAVEMVKAEAITATGTFVITKLGYLVGVISLGLLLYLNRLGLIVWR